ncbi:MAG TPA: hypothetical protein VFS43_13540 [Polyangiaceae bacterium]|nr:hypothetical protein [Polyangiaceae bacterium]
MKGILMVFGYATARPCDMAGLKRQVLIAASTASLKRGSLDLTTRRSSTAPASVMMKRTTTKPSTPSALSAGG